MTTTDPTTHTRPNLLDAVTPDHLRDEADEAINALLALLPETLAALDAATAVEERMGAVPHGLVDDQFDAELPGSVRGQLGDVRNLIAKLAEPSQEPSEEVLQWALDRAVGVRDATLGATLGRLDGLLQRHDRLQRAIEGTGDDEAAEHDTPAVRAAELDPVAVGDRLHAIERDVERIGNALAMASALFGTIKTGEGTRPPLYRVPDEHLAPFAVRAADHQARARALLAEVDALAAEQEADMNAAFSLWPSTCEGDHSRNAQHAPGLEAVYAARDAVTAIADRIEQDR